LNAECKMRTVKVAFFGTLLSALRRAERIAENVTAKDVIPLALLVVFGNREFQEQAASAQIGNAMNRVNLNARITGRLEPAQARRRRVLVDRPEEFPEPGIPRTRHDHPFARTGGLLVDTHDLGILESAAFDVEYQVVLDERRRARRRAQ